MNGPNADRLTLGARITLIVLAGSLATAVLVAAAQGWLLWRSHQQEAMQRLTQIERSHLPSLAQGIWLIDSARVEILLDGISLLPDVGAVQLVDDAGRQYQRGTPLGEASLATERWTLEVEDAGERFEVGELVVELSDVRLMERLRARMQLVAITTSGALLAMALLTLWLLRRWVTGPIGALGRATQSLDLEHLGELRLDIGRAHGVGELRQLLEEFDGMRRRLAEALARRDASERDLAAHREHLEQLVAERTAELEQRNVELDAYAHTVAHDLKHPLTGIAGASQLLRDAAARLDTAQRAQLTDSILRNTRLMQGIIDALLLLARARSDVEVPLQPIDLHPVVAAARTRLADGVAQAQAQIEVDLGVGEAMGYAPWIEEALVNYLSNALRYGGEAPRILITSERVTGGVRVCVRDHGPGVAADRVDELFDRFVRPDLRHVESEGLGLSIVKRIIERQGGTVGYTPAAGGGSAFWLRLPVVQGGSGIEGGVSAPPGPAIPRDPER